MASLRRLYPHINEASLSCIHRATRYFYTSLHDLVLVF